MSRFADVLAGSPAARTVLALAIGAVGGAIADFLNVPLAWMIGAMISTTIAAAAGLPLMLPAPLRLVMIAVLGAVLGSAFTPDIPAAALKWWPSLAALPLYTGLVTALLWIYLRRAGGHDAVTSYYASVPGGLNEMVLMAREAGADDRTVSLVHATRVLFVVCLLPLWFWVTQDYVRDTTLFNTGAAMTWTEAGWLALAGVAGFVIARMVRMPAAALTGPLIAAGALYVSGVVTAAPPAPVRAIAQLVVGTALGCRFTGTPFRQIGRTMVLGIGATAIMLALTAVFAFALHAFAPALERDALLLAFAPGGLAETSLIALGLGINAAFVSTHHVIRIGMLVIVGPFVGRRLFRSGKPSESNA